MSESNFFDISASDIIGAYLKKEQIDAQSKVEVLAAQGATQNKAINAPAIESAQVAVDTGYVKTPANSSGSYWSRIPKGLLWGGLMVLGGGLFMVARK
jgi:hypothetical protein